MELRGQTPVNPTVIDSAVLNACSDLILAHPIDLSSSSFPVLRFWHRIGIWADDHATIDISLDGGTTWSAKPLKDYTNLVLGDWTLEELGLSAYKTSPILIRFRLRDDGTGYWHYPGQPGMPVMPVWVWKVSSGWDIDDVEIRELLYPTVDGLPGSLIVQITEIDTSNSPTIRAAVTVADANGVAMTGLKTPNFSAFEDGKERSPITVEADIPVVSVALALDYSNSMGSKAIADMEKAAKGFVDLVKADDRVAVIKFAKGVKRTRDFTNDKSDLEKAIGDKGTAPDGSATWLYEATYQAISDAAGQPGKRAVVVMTDGKDNQPAPRPSVTQVVKYAQDKGVPVFTIGLGAEIDEQVLITIAQQTGGVYYPAATSSNLLDIYQKIAGVLKNQYIVTYESAVCQPGGAADQEHELKILVEKGAAYGWGAKRFRCPATGTPEPPKK